MIRTVTGADIPGLLAGCSVEAFKLELRDDYATAGEREALDRWRRGNRELGDAEAEGLRAWMDIVRDLTSAGVAVRRVRVVTEPTTEYIRFESTTVPLQQRAGEDIRYLPRNHAAVADLPDRDFWLFDDRRVLMLNFADDGTPRPHELHDDRETIARHQVIRDTVWSYAIPYNEYVPHLR